MTIKGINAWQRGIIALLILLAVYGVLIEPYRVQVHDVPVKDPSLAKVLGQAVVVQLSDLHISSMGPRERRVLKIVGDLRPDIVFLTGDYVAWKGAYGPALDFLSQLHAKIGVWAVMGEYDYSRSRKSCLFCHEEGSASLTRRHQVHFLKDRTEKIRLPQGDLSITGIDGDEEPPAYPSGGDPVPPGERGAVIVLAHCPLNFDRITDDRSLLMLAGDTHGGQIPLPGLLFRKAGYEKNDLYSQGLYERGQRRLFVSRGIGTSHLPVRLLRPPEVVVFHFVP